jgi:hypothetical protein
MSDPVKPLRIVFVSAPLLVCGVALCAWMYGKAGDVVDVETFGYAGRPITLGLGWVTGVGLVGAALWTAVRFGQNGKPSA